MAILKSSKSNETSHVQVPMHHCTYTSTEAMTTAYHYNQIEAYYIHRKNTTGLCNNYVITGPCNSTDLFSLQIEMCGSHGFSRGVCTMMHWYLDMTCFITF